MKMAAEVTTYYERLSVMAIDQRIRDEVLKVANKVADKIISEYKLTKFITQAISDEGKLGEKLFIALEVEKQK